MSASQKALYKWFAAHDAYHKASDVYNARVRYVRAEQDRDPGALVMNCHQEYKALNEAQRAALKMDEEFYQIMKGDADNLVAVGQTEDRK